MDQVDLFYAHALSKVEEVKDERVIAVLKKLKEEGKTRFIGFSAHAGKPELLDAAIEAGIYDVILLSYNFKLSNLKETEEAIGPCRQSRYRSGCHEDHDRRNRRCGR